MAIVEQVYIKVSGALISQDAMLDLIYVEVESSYELPDMCVVSFRDDDLELLESGPFKIGEAIEVAFAAGDEESAAPVTVMKGEITALEPKFGDGYGATFTVRGYDKSHRLNRGTNSAAWNEKTDSDLIKAVLGDGGLAMSVDATTGGINPHYFQRNNSNLAFVHQLARANGLEVFANGDRIEMKKAATGRSGSAVTLEWGEDLREFRPRASAAGQVNEVNVRGWDVKKKAAIIGKATSSKITPKNGFSDGGAVAKKAFGAAVHVEVRRPVNTQKQADALAQAILDEINAGFVEAEGLCDGYPSIVSGTELTLKNLGQQFSGKYIVTAARHIYNTERYFTEFSVSGMRPRLVSELATGAAVTASEIDRWLGVVPAIVTNINDPDKNGRVKLKYPWLDDQLESGWVRVMAMGGGGTRGFTWLPEVNDEVLVAFEQGDFNFPYVLGGLYNGKDKMPDAAQHAQNGKVEKRTLKTRAGHLIRFTDKSGEEKIEIIDGKTNTSIVMDTQNKVITITSKGKVIINTDAETEVNAKKDVKIDTKANASVTVKGNATIDAKGNATIKSGGSMTVQATGSLTLKGASVTIQSQGSFTLKGGGMGNVEAGGILNVKGSMLNLN